MGFSGYSSVHWPPALRERIDEVGLDAEQAQLEHLEQAAGTRADDDDFGDDRIAQRDCTVWASAVA